VATAAGEEAAEDKNDRAGARTRAEKRRTNRGALPTHLPHVDVTIAPEDTNGPCCRAPMHVIGEEISKRLDVIPRRASTSSARCWRSGWAIRGTPAALASAARAYPHRGQDRD
jgi:transposase